MKTAQFRSIITFSFLFVSLVGFAQERKVLGQINDFLLIQVGDKIGVFDQDTNYVIKPNTYTKIVYEGKYDLYKCYKGDQFEIFLDGFIKVESPHLFTEILGREGYSLKLKSTEGIGLISDVKLIVPPLYDKIKEETETYFECCMNYVVEKNGKKGLYVDGKLVLKPEYNDFHKEGYGLPIFVQKDNKKGILYPVVTKDDELVVFLEPIYESIEYLDDIDAGRFYSVSKDGLQGIFLITTDRFPIEKIDSSAFFVIPPIYKSIEWKKKKVFHDLFSFPVIVVSVKKDGLLLINENKSTNYLKAKDVVYADYQETPIAIKNSGGKYQLLIYGDKLAVGAELYDEIVPFHDVPVVRSGVKWSVADPYGNAGYKSLQFDSLEKAKEAYLEGEYLDLK